MSNTQPLPRLLALATLAVSASTIGLQQAAAKNSPINDELCLQGRRPIDLSDQYPAPKCQGSNGVCYAMAGTATVEAARARQDGHVKPLSETFLLAKYVEGNAEG